MRIQFYGYEQKLLAKQHRWVEISQTNVREFWPRTTYSYECINNSGTLTDGAFLHISTCQPCCRLPLVDHAERFNHRRHQLCEEISSVLRISSEPGVQRHHVRKSTLKNYDLNVGLLTSAILWGCVTMESTQQSFQTLNSVRFYLAVLSELSKLVVSVTRFTHMCISVDNSLHINAKKTKNND